MEQATLTTARLQLVPLTDEHLEHEVELDSDPEVMRYLAHGPSSRETEGSRELIRHAFEDLNASLVYADTMAANQASRVLEGRLVRAGLVGPARRRLG